jgi:hypothetical protein
MDAGDIYRNQKTGFELKKGEAVRLVNRTGKEEVLIMDFGGNNFMGLTKTRRSPIKWWLLALKSIL